jgi:hypothetical protein
MEWLDFGYSQSKWVAEQLDCAAPFWSDPVIDIASDVLRWDIDQAFACLGFSSGRFQFHAVP